ncbi:MAG TPA: Gfo/Idh/MocA family oxidoreductase [Opitutaceae bacterium]|nr:Gfo/Idh/MocA family oxidoreductase [Opitutaceae bacterium]HND62580.1 Gfo/Idh/MocA family oxidoreductase [Opitutaceae bacterium]
MPADPARPLRLAMLGMIPGNGHPYSWSAIINGYDRAAMASCPYAGIPIYLGGQPHESVRVPGVQVTHLWTDNPTEAPHVAQASLIPHVVARPEDVIGHVDAVLVSTDDGTDHVRRARPFVEAGLPVFVDKPLATTVEDLRTFIAWKRAGRRILSSSGMRYAPELATLIGNLPTLGDLRWLSFVSIKTWDRYGIHVLEPAFRVLGPGFLSVRLETQPGLEVAHLLHRSGVQVTLPIIYDGGPSFGTGQVCGTKGQTTLRFADTYTAFRNQLLSYIEFVRSGQDPYPFDHTIEMMCVIIAGIRSREQGSRRVDVAEISAQVLS